MDRARAAGVGWAWRPSGSTGWIANGMSTDTSERRRSGQPEWQQPTGDSSPSAALTSLVRLLAQQAARDWLTVSSHPADQTHYEETIHDQA